MDQKNLDDLEVRYREMSGAHKAWVIPILTALEELGGSARPRDVREKIRERMAGRLSPKQWEYVVRAGRLGWSRFSMCELGLLAGETGVWQVTELGRSLLARLRDEDALNPEDIPEEDFAREDIQTESVPATDFSGYDVPLLRVMADGITTKKEILRALGERLRADLLPGDMRVMPKGQTVWDYRASWALSGLKSEGQARNPSLGRWEITDAGLERLKKEEPTWQLRDAQHSRALVRGHQADTGLPTEVARDSSWSLREWKQVRSVVGQEMFSSLDARLRPDLGANPAYPISRNVILYGPPGTGKTFLAKKVAMALTGENEIGPESRWKIVQFHPSYAYEDFIQGLKPNLEETTLRYALEKGPFLNLCEAAEQDPDRFYVLLIDEINRGDPARIFGELLYALEYRGQPVDLPLGGQLIVPLNLVIVGTMNSVDRSVALVDYALRRRFGFVRVDPDPSVIGRVRSSEPAAPAAAVVLLRFNEWIEKRLDREHTLGHSYFLNPAIPLTDATALDRVWELDVLPLLQEYFFGEPVAIEEATRKWKELATAAASITDPEDPSGIPG